MEKLNYAQIGIASIRIHCNDKKQTHVLHKAHSFLERLIVDVYNGKIHPPLMSWIPIVKALFNDKKTYLQKEMKSEFLRHKTEISYSKFKACMNL